MDIIDGALHCLSHPDEPFPHMTPWYRHWTGSCHENGTYEFSGVFERAGNKVTITELPIGVSIEGYKEKVLDPLVADGKVASYIADHPDENSVKFVVYAKESSFDEKWLKLKSTIQKNCMYVLGESGKIRKYETVSALMTEWMDIKMKFMAKRKASMMAAYGADLAELDDKIQFVDAVVSGRIDIRKPTAEVEANIKALGVLEERVTAFLGMPLRSLSKDKVDALRSTREEVRATKLRLESTTPAALYKADLKTLRKEVVKFYATDGAAAKPKAAGQKRKAASGGRKAKKAKK